MLASPGGPTKGKVECSQKQIVTDSPPGPSKVKGELRIAHGEMTRSGRISSLLVRFSRGRGIMALADQVMVSGANFATNIVLVRGLGLSDFGKFSIAYVLLLYSNALQMSFVASPMLSIAPLMPSRAKRQFVDGMLAFQLSASLLLFVIFALVGAVSHIFTAFYSLPCIFAFAFCVGTYQLQDWLRRYYFLYNKIKFALICDFISYVIQLALLAVLWRTGQLTLLRTFLVMCITSIAAITMGPITDRLRPAMGHLREAWAQCRILSRDLLVANQVRWLGFQGVLLVGTWIVGTVAAGGLRATQSLAGPVNLVLTSLENVVPIRIAEELNKTGARGAYRFTQRAIVGGIALFGVLIVPIGVFGRPILRFIYGPTMVVFYVPMLLQLVGVVMQAASNLWVYFYRGIRDSRALLRANALSAITSIATVYLFGHLWGASGIVTSSLVGLASAVAYFIMHWMRHRERILLQYPARSSFKRIAAVSVPGNEYAEIDLIPDGSAEW